MGVPWPLRFFLGGRFPLQSEPNKKRVLYDEKPPKRLQPERAKSTNPKKCSQCPFFLRKSTDHLSGPGARWVGRRLRRSPGARAAAHRGGAAAEDLGALAAALRGRAAQAQARKSWAVWAVWGVERGWGEVWMRGWEVWRFREVWRGLERFGEVWRGLERLGG